MTRRDLLFQDEIRDLVREAYRGIPRGAGRRMAERLYHPEDLDTLPAQAVEWALGVGDPVRDADLPAGATVLDLGCGGGIDTVLAARRVGPGGRVVGLDLLPEMLARARAAAEAAGVGARCRFEVGEMEAIPLPDASVDVVIANGVLNLSPRKSRTLAEVARVLRPGGRLCAADLTIDGELPPEVLASEAAWAGCIAGAVSERVLGGKLRRAGFTDVVIDTHRPFSIDDAALYPLFTSEAVALMRRLLPEAAQRQVAVAVRVRAVKPVVDARPPRTHAPVSSGARRLTDLPAEDVEAPGVAIRHLKRVEDVELKVLDVEPGGSTPRHTHPHAHEGVVVGGRGRLRLEGRDDPLRPGDVFSVQPQARHQIVSDGDEPLRFVCMDCFVDDEPGPTESDAIRPGGTSSSKA